MLELILDIKIRKVEIAEQQKNVDITYDGKGVRFDVYVDDAENTVYDIEMQTTRQNYICEQDYSVKLGDEATKVIVNAAGSRNGLSEDMFLSWIFYQRKKQIVILQKNYKGLLMNQLLKRNGRWSI